VRLLYLSLDLKLELDEAEAIHVREVVGNLARLGHEVRVLVSRESQISKVHLGPLVSSSPVGGGGITSEVVRVLREVRMFRPHALYERRFLPKIAAAASILTGVPAVVEINGLVEEEARMRGQTTTGSVLRGAVRRSLHSAIFRRMKLIVAVTDGIAAEMARIYRLPRERITVIENGANTSLFRPLDQAACLDSVGLDPARHWICFEGGLNPWYDLPSLIRSVGRLREADNRIALVIVGDGPLRPTLEDQVREAGLQRDVRFVGHVPYKDVPLYIGASDVGVAPLTRERNLLIGVSPMKVYEYVACGRPVVVTRVPGIDEWVMREGVGRLAEPQDPESLANGILEVMGDEELKGKVAAGGPEIVKRQHSWSAVAAAISTICAGLVTSELPVDELSPSERQQ